MAISRMGIIRTQESLPLFIEEKDGTLMIDTFVYKSPFGPIGFIVDKLFLEKYVTVFISSRAKELKKIAENNN